MCDQDHFDDDLEQFERMGNVTRRQFGVLLGAGMAMMLPQVANAVTVTEAEVTVKTPDGTADCYWVHPASGTAPAVLVWPDIFGLRPSFRQMGKRLAETGTRCWWSTPSTASSRLRRRRRARPRRFPA
jgi:carboxymethylenebutenolidase